MLDQLCGATFFSMIDLRRVLLDSVWIGADEVEVDEEKVSNSWLAHEKNS